jgi:hypothetical protein
VNVEVKESEDFVAGVRKAEGRENEKQATYKRKSEWYDKRMDGGTTRKEGRL